MIGVLPSTKESLLPKTEVISVNYNRYQLTTGVGFDSAILNPFLAGSHTNF